MLKIKIRSIKWACIVLGIAIPLASTITLCILIWTAAASPEFAVKAQFNVVGEGILELIIMTLSVPITIISYVIIIKEITKVQA